ncbi:MAG TPA: cytochrome-c oxidase [Gammaproteobacteria bacterium]
MMTAMVIAMLTAITVWWLLIQRLREKPWTHQGVATGSQENRTASAPHVGLWVFLAVVTSLFGLFASAYVMRMHAHSGVVHWHPLTEPRVLWVNTAVLVLASAALQRARNAAVRTDLDTLRTFFPLGGALTVLFLLGQVWAWRELAVTGLYDRTDPAYAFFILLTAVHGVHLLGGLVVLGRASARIWRGLSRDNVVAVAKARQSVELCTVYWHCLLLIWLGLFALLLST